MEYTQKKSIKRIKENITEVEYKKLMAHIRGDESIREHTRVNLLRTFTLLFYTGMRLNELQDLKIFHIKELLESGTTKVPLQKTSTERKLYITPSFKKELLKIFDLKIEEVDNRIISKGSNKSKKTGINNIVFIQQVNFHLKNILGDGYTSHSFRQGLLSDFGAKGVNVKIMSKFIGHSDVKTTMRYVVPTDEDIMMNLVR